MNITIANPTPNSMRMEYYVEFEILDITYNCEFYRDGTRQIRKFFGNGRSRRISGNPNINKTLTALHEGSVVVGNA